jgi:putative peptidoglycan lipid II flippase
VYTLGIGILLAAGLLFPVPLLTVGSHFSSEQLAANTLLIRLGILFFCLQTLNTYLTCILEMYHRFATALLSPLNALLPLVCLLVFGRLAGIRSMMYGFVCAHLLQTVLLSRALFSELHWRFTFKRSAVSSRLKHNLVSIIIQNILSILSAWLPVYLLSGMGMGLVSALNYAKQLADTPNEILSQRIANLQKIQMTEHIAQGNWPQGNTNYLAVNHFLFFLLAPLAIFSCFFAPEIIMLFFKRGAFTVQDGLLAAAFLRPLLLVMLCAVPGLLFGSVLSAARIWKEHLPYGLFYYVLFLPILPITMHLWGGLAYPYTFLAVQLLGSAATYVCLRRYAPLWNGPAVLRQMGRILSLNILALVPTAVYGWYFASANPWVSVFTGGIIFVGTLCALSYYSGDLQFFLRQCWPEQPLDLMNFLKSRTKRDKTS